MIPSNKWFPSGLSERATWFQNFVTVLPNLATQLGITTAEVTSVTTDASVMTELPLIVEQIDAYKESIRKFRIAVTENPPGSTQAVFPSPFSIGIPPTVANGIFERISRLRDKIMLSANYTDVIGAQLGILADNPAPPVQIKPIVKAEPLYSDYKFNVQVMKMGMPAFKILIRRMDSENWMEAGFGTNSPLIVKVQPSTPGQAERLHVCVQLMDKNEPVGVPSDAIYVTVNP